MLLLKVEDTSALLKSLKEEQEAASLKAKTAADERHFFKYTYVYINVGNCFMPDDFRFVRAEADIHELRSRSEGGIGGVKRQSQELKVN